MRKIFSWYNQAFFIQSLVVCIKSQFSAIKVEKHQDTETVEKTKILSLQHSNMQIFQGFTGNSFPLLSHFP